MAWSRRRFLKTFGWTSGGLIVFAAGATTLMPTLPFPHLAMPTAGDAAAWLRLTPDGRVELLLPRSEIGQGIAVALRQIVAEETGVALDRVVAVLPRTDLVPPARPTVGSDSIKEFGPRLASAAAALGVLLAGTKLHDGTFDADRIAELTRRSRLVDAASVDAARPVSFRRDVTHRVVGKDHPTDAIEAIVTGSKLLFADDVTLPDMVFGAVLRGPTLGARLVSLNDNAVRSVPGFLTIHREGQETYLVAETRGALERCLSAVKPEWEDGKVSQREIDTAIDVDAALARGGLEHVLVNAGTRAAVDQWDVDLRLDVPMAAHAPIEPHIAVATVTPGGQLEVWTGTQDVTFVQRTLSYEFGLPLKQITVIGCRVGGGFGGKMFSVVALDAARLARTLKRPVKVQWSGAEAFSEVFHRPPSSHRVRARLGPDGALQSWQHAICSGHVIFSDKLLGATLQPATRFIADPGVTRGAIAPYRSSNTRIEMQDVRLPVATGAWRGLGAAPNAWAIETAIDQLARRRGIDPLALRLRLVAPEWPRLRRVIERVAAMSDWSSRTTTATRGFGFASGIYKDMSYAAAVAEVVFEGGGMRVERIWCAHDCGAVVNPDQVRAQIEGNIAWAVGMTLVEELTVADNRLRQGDFSAYSIPRFTDVPKMQIALVDEGDAPTGAGETAIVAVPAAITNAIAGMIGSPVTRLPWRPTAAL